MSSIFIAGSSMEPHVNSLDAHAFIVYLLNASRPASERRSVSAEIVKTLGNKRRRPSDSADARARASVCVCVRACMERRRQRRRE